MEVEPAEATEIRLEIDGEGEGVPTDAGNLAWAAAAAFLADARQVARVRLRLTKRVPVASGLGGGSSDAAAVIRALAGLYPGCLADDQIRDLALRLGADVPFFLDPRPAHVSGIGERIAPLEGLPELDVLLVHPGVPLSTSQVYRAFDAEGGGLTEAFSGSTIEKLSGLLRSVPGDRPPALKGLLGNDLEPAALRLCPKLAELREKLRESGALGVGLSGSGPTLFGIFAGTEAAREASQRDWGSRARVWRTRSLASPPRAK